MPVLLSIDNLCKGFASPLGRREVIDVASWRLDEGEEVALAGASGQGKTTFLHLLAGIMKADSGQILFGQRDLTSLSESVRDHWRSRHVGFVFQTFNLLQGLSAHENVWLATLLAGQPDARRAAALLKRVDLEDYRDHFPEALSVGQQQRVAVARALVHRPQLVLADEPTGSLDPERAREALALIREVCREEGAALVCVSHDVGLLAQFSRVEYLRTLNQVLA